LHRNGLLRYVIAGKKEEEGRKYGNLIEDAI
jgi:hypothetical protein